MGASWGANYRAERRRIGLRGVGSASSEDNVTVLRNWKTSVDPLVPPNSRWHSKQTGVVKTTDDLLVSSMRDAAQEADDTDSISAFLISWVGRELLRKLREYENEPRLLVKLADTGRVVTIIQKSSKTLREISNLRATGKLIRARQQFMVEREARIMMYGILLDDEAEFLAAMGDDTQQLEILTLLKHGFEMYGAVLTPREKHIIVKVYETICHYSGIVIGSIPGWFATTTCTWPRAAKTVMKDITEEKFLRQVDVWSELHHSNVLSLYGACHVGTPFAIHEYSVSASKLHLSWKLWQGILGGLQYMHERGLTHERFSPDIVVGLVSEGRLVLSGMGLVRIAEDDHISRSGMILQSSDVKAFGLVLLNWLESARIGKVSPGPFVNNDEWILLRYMCTTEIATVDRVACMMDILVNEETKQNGSHVRLDILTTEGDTALNFNAIQTRLSIPH